LLAQYLGIPYVNFDAASPPDLYSAKAQLEGSGRGIVGSHQAGRLEQCAKHHQGCVLEVSDIDHASPQVASGLGDIFLQCLETGEAQSATGTLFSAASVIFVFSINGPGGADEQVRKRLGFGDPPSPGEVTARVSEVIKNMLSSAFLSRIGTPIVFDPLEGKALALIEERAVERAARTAAGRLGIRVNAVEIEPSLGEWLVSTAGRGMVSHGARGLLEIARSHVAVAMAGIASCEGKSGVLRLERGEGGGIRVSLL
jgi:ATP-dependent Clp protease ATP-binding subunit ClpA